MFIVACGGADGSGWQDVGVDGAGVDVAVVVGEDGVVGVEGAGGGVIVAAAAGVGVDIDGAGVAGDAVVVAFAIAVVVETRSRQGVSNVIGAGLRVSDVGPARWSKSKGR